MTADSILYILGILIFWDFSLHVIELFHWDKFLIKSKSWFSYYYPHFRWIKTLNGSIERPNWNKFYQRFWVSFWGTALILLITYIVVK